MRAALRRGVMVLLIAASAIIPPSHAARITQPKETYKHKAELLVKFMGFIPKDHEDHPFYFLPGVSSTFGGDDRSFNASAPLDNYRVRDQVVAIAVEVLSAAGIKEGTRAKDTGFTNEYHKPTSVDPALADAVNPDGRLTAAAKADTSFNDGNMRIAVSVADDADMAFAASRLAARKIRLRFVGSAVDPLSLAANAVGCAAQWDVTVEVDGTNKTSPTYSISGLHVFYPSYEAYLGNQPILQYNVLATTNGPLRMCGPTAAFQGTTGAPILP